MRIPEALREATRPIATALATLAVTGAVESPVAVADQPAAGNHPQIVGHNHYAKSPIPEIAGFATLAVLGAFSIGLRRKEGGL